MPLLSTKFATLTIHVLKLVQNLSNCTKHAKTLLTQLFKTFFELNSANLALKWLVLAQKSLF